MRWLALGLTIIVTACGGKPSPSRIAGASSPDPAPHVIVVSVDGLMPESYTAPDKHGLKVPTLRKMAADGAASPGALSIYPSVTYPAHISMATGHHPRDHGIGTNYAWDPVDKNLHGWRWYAEDIRKPTIWDAATKAGKRVALVNWPVTVGARVDRLVPEYWRAGTSDDQKLHRALSTPGLLEAVAERFPDFWTRFTPPAIRDSGGFDVAVHLIETRKPQLLMVHGWWVDEMEHNHGPWSQEAKAAIEEVDRQIARLIAAAKKAGTWKNTFLILTSDHGFAPISKKIRGNTLLAQNGFIPMKDGKPTDAWKATSLANGGTLLVYVRDATDEATKSALRKLFTDLSTKPDSGIARVIEAAEIQRRGGDRSAFLAVEARPGFAFSKGWTGKVIDDTSTKGHHGWNPADPAMAASLIVYGPRVTATKIEGARLIDVAPTVAELLRIALPDTAGKPLPIATR